jgi:hypothetical protein
MYCADQSVVLLGTEILTRLVPFEQYVLCPEREFGQTLFRLDTCPERKFEEGILLNF